MSDNKKPRICEVLGVEVGEEWRDKNGGYTYRISDTGRREMKGIDGFWHKTDIEAMLAELINHPENIIHKRRWSKDDIRLAKAIKRLFPGIESIHRGAYNSTGLYIHDTCHYRLNDDLFPSLKEGESVTLDEILEAENDV